jgi:hypothetical protein
LLAASVIAALLCLALPVAWQGGLSWPAAPAAAAGVAYTGVVASAVAFWAWNTGVAAIGPVAASRHMMLMPVYGAAIAWAALGETVGVHQALGGALVLLGLHVARLAGPQAPRRAWRWAAAAAALLLVATGARAADAPPAAGTCGRGWLIVDAALSPTEPPRLHTLDRGPIADRVPPEPGPVCPGRCEP